jgi:hypothetical protein
MLGALVGGHKLCVPEDGRAVRIGRLYSVFVVVCMFICFSPQYAAGIFLLYGGSACRLHDAAMVLQPTLGSSLTRFSVCF